MGHTIQPQVVDPPPQTAFILIQRSGARRTRRTLDDLEVGQVAARMCIECRRPSVGVPLWTSQHPSFGSVRGGVELTRILPIQTRTLTEGLPLRHLPPPVPNREVPTDRRTDVLGNP
jgi:hypothetical protein